MSNPSVSASDLEEGLARLRSDSPGPQVGIFGPDSANWKVNRESALFLAAGRAALLQLAHPWVAAAIHQHSHTLNNAIRRFHNTFRLMFTMSFGSLDEALAAAKRLHHMHEGIRGVLPEAAARFSTGSSYHANEVEALVWVYATLTDSSLLAYNLALPSLSASEQEQYYAENRRAAALFGIPPEKMPPDLAGFHSYMQFALASDMLGASETARVLAHQLQDGAGMPIRPPFWFRALTLHLLPPRFRDEFGFRYGDSECKGAERALRWIRRIYPRLPAMVRFVAPYTEAMGRLGGRRSPPWHVRISNRLWIGQSNLFRHP
jgi:uncharacterized protein (DUF2236 family)